MQVWLKKTKQLSGSVAGPKTFGFQDFCDEDVFGRKEWSTIRDAQSDQQDKCAAFTWRLKTKRASRWRLNRHQPNLHWFPEAALWPRTSSRVSVQLRRTFVRCLCINMFVSMRWKIPVECHFFSHWQREHESSWRDDYSHRAERHFSRRLSRPSAARLQPLHSPDWWKEPLVEETPADKVYFRQNVHDSHKVLACSPPAGWVVPGSRSSLRYGDAAGGHWSRPAGFLEHLILRRAREIL